MSAAALDSAQQLHSLVAAACRVEGREKVARKEQMGRKKGTKNEKQKGQVQEGSRTRSVQIDRDRDKEVQKSCKI